MPVENSKDGVLHSGKIIYFFQANERKLLNLHLLTIFTKPLITLFGFLKFDISSISLKFKGSFDYFNVGKLDIKFVPHSLYECEWEHFRLDESRFDHCATRQPNEYQTN
jgi:hypothetical protein